jgi:hypothetical protein
MFTITKQQSEAFIRNLKLSNGLIARMRAQGINIQQPPVRPKSRRLRLHCVRWLIVSKALTPTRFMSRRILPRPI